MSYVQHKDNRIKTKMEHSTMQNRAKGKKVTSVVNTQSKNTLKILQYLKKMPELCMTFLKLLLKSFYWVIKSDRLEILNLKNHETLLQEQFYNVLDKKSAISVLRKVYLWHLCFPCA